MAACVSLCLSTLVVMLAAALSSGARQAPDGPPHTTEVESHARMAMYVDAGKEGPKPISPILFGAFFEELSHAGEGGLYAELVADRRFHYGWDEGGVLSSGPYFPPADTSSLFSKVWRILELNETERPATVEDLDRNRPLVPILSCGNPQFNKTCSTASLRLDLDSVVGVANTGYWGMRIAPGASYNLTVYARARGPVNAIKARLESSNGTVYAEVVLGGNVADSWALLEAVLRVPSGIMEGEDGQGRLVLLPTSVNTDIDHVDMGILRQEAVGETLQTNGSRKKAPQPSNACGEPEMGTMWLGWVSLFPAATYKGRPNGLRKDLAELLEQMKPGFLRFPGGSFVEGETIDTGFWWKRTVGPPVNRSGHYNSVWGYRTEDGLGLLEYFQLCEDIGAEPIWVVNAGVSAMQDVPPEGGMGRPGIDVFVQDVVDALEYLMGNATSVGGKLRIVHGRHDPFHVKYLAIGNEDCHHGYYPANFIAFQNKIRALWPHIRFIANCDLSSPTNMLPVLPGYVKQPLPRSLVDLFDAHVYETSQYFMDNVHQYDDYNRTAPHVFLSEFSAHCVPPDCVTGTLSNAVAEAAWMTGLERNGDVVELAAYAPLFVNVNWQSWSPNAIHFNSASAFGTPSYWISRLFGSNRGTHVLNTSIQCDSPDSNFKRDSSAKTENGQCSKLAHSVTTNTQRLGDIVLKLVNYSPDANIHLVIKISEDLLRSPIQRASWTVVTGPSVNAENTFDDPQLVAEVTEDVSSNIDSSGRGLTLSLPAFSASVVRLSSNLPTPHHHNADELVIISYSSNTADATS